MKLKRKNRLIKWNLLEMSIKISAIMYRISLEQQKSL